MIIDFHAHIFPEKIAAKTVSLLADKCKMTPYSDGTVNSLLYKMSESGVDLSVILPVVTNPKQFDSINSFAAEINSLYRDKTPGLLSFGGIHPLCEDIPGKMKRIKEMGFLGVKLHPDYQETFIDDEGYVQILSMAKELDLIVVTHAGADPGYRDFPIRCTPERARNLIKKVPHSKLVLAHFGANELYDQVLSTLAGEDVYFDTAFALRSVDEGFFKRLVEKHGEDRILFATDTPWSDIGSDIERIRSFGLSKTVEEKIFSENAKKLLRI